MKRICNRAEAQRRFESGVKQAMDGLTARALETLAEVRRRCLLLGWEVKAAECDLVSGMALNREGEFGAAIDRFERARECFESLPPTAAAAECSMRIGYACAQIGKLKEAATAYRRAAIAYKNCRRDREAAECRRAAGLACKDLRRWEEALAEIQSSLSESRAMGDFANEALAERTLGQILTAKKEFEKAREHFERARRIHARIGDPVGIADVESGLGNLFGARKDWRQAIACYEKALRGYRHELESSQGGDARANELWNKLAENEFNIGAALLHPRCGAERQGLKRLESCLDAFETTLGAKRRLPPAYVEASRHAVLCSLRLGWIEKAFRFFERPRFWAFSKAGTSETAVPNWNLQPGDLTALLPNDRSCLVDFLLWNEDGRIRVFLVTRRKGLELAVFPEGSRKRLDDCWKKWAHIYKSTSERQPSIVETACLELGAVVFETKMKILGEGNLAAPSRTLRDHLDRTLGAAERDSPRLMFLIPHLYLSNMPLHAAYSREPKEGAEFPRYLLHDYVIVYAHSVAALSASRKRRFATAGRKRALVVANSADKDSLAASELDEASADGGKQRRGLSRLPTVAKEARTVGGMLSKAGYKTTVLMSEIVDRQEFLHGSDKTAGLAGRCHDHLHLALHAQLDVEGRPSTLLFETPEGEREPLDEWRIRELDLTRLRCVVGATCYSAAPDPFRAEHTGLAAAFLRAGAGTVVGALYGIPDRESFELVRRLYRIRLQERKSWAEALQRAQMEMSSFGADRQHLLSPFFWAAFVVYGMP